MKSELCFIIPYYNHPENINKLLNTLMQYGLNIIIVDDGSTPALEDVIDIHSLPIITARHEKNAGKGSAVITGMKKAVEMNFSACFQIDADAQHDLNKIGEFIECYKQFPASLICAKPIYNNDIPKSRLYGRKITAFWVSINTLGGIKEDSMIGMRIYPLNNIDRVLKSVKSKRMEFDTDILLCYYRLGIKIKWIDVCITYSGNYVSHFRIIKDNLLISIMHARHFFYIPLIFMKKISGRIG